MVGIRINASVKAGNDSFNSIVVRSRGYRNTGVAAPVKVDDAATDEEAADEAVREGAPDAAEAAAEADEDEPDKAPTEVEADGRVDEVEADEAAAVAEADAERAVAVALRAYS